MQIRVKFFSYFRDLTGQSEMLVEIPEGETVRELLARVEKLHPALARSASSVLVAVGLDYQTRAYRLKVGDEVSVFPPVQGG